MKVRMIKLAAGPEGVYRIGEVVEVSQQTGLAFVVGGYAERVEEAPERAVEPEAERAVTVERKVEVERKAPARKAPTMKAAKK